MATGAYDANGIWNYGEDDNIALFSDTLNLLSESTSDAFTDDRSRIGVLEAGSLSGLIPVKPSSVVIATGSGSVNTLGTVSFTGATAVSLNNVFTTTYNHYRIVISAQPGGGTYVDYRLRAAGSDNSTLVYSTEVLQAQGTSVSASLEGNQNAGKFGYFEAYEQQAVIDIFNPKAAKTTRAISLSTRGRNGGGSVLFTQTYASIFDNTTQFDGLTFIFASATTGAITVYGYNN